jgi:phosphoribosylformimino-5-aminoimidazole carboxamide ribotide isomerase
MSFCVYPAIDVREGRVVRLRQGDYLQQTLYAPDPLQLARQYAAEGAAWLHLVDLDAARKGGYSILPLLQQIAATTSLAVQTGGGVRSETDVAQLLDAGAARVVVGSLAVREPQQVLTWIDRFGPERITVALDTRLNGAGRWCLPLHGWTEDSGRDLDSLLQLFGGSGLRHVLCTDIACDGMLSGPNLDLYRYLRTQAPWAQLQASGGVRDPDDVVAARDSGCAGVILGRALLEGQLQLGSALAC